MEVKRIVLEQLLLETKIAQLAANIKFVLNVNDTFHSNQQKTRHSEKGIVITDEEIITVLEKAKNKIANYIITDKIKEKIDFAVKEFSGKQITLAVVPKYMTPYRWELTVKTVWSEKAEGMPLRLGPTQLLITV